METHSSILAWRTHAIPWVAKSQTRVKRLRMHAALSFLVAKGKETARGCTVPLFHD